MKYKSILTKPFLEQKYIVERLSTPEIAKIVNCGQMTVFRYLIGYYIPIRTKSEAMKGKYRGEMGERSHSWKGGRAKDKDGYILIYSPKHPHKNCNGYVREHRLVVEKHLRRYLTSEEIIHHVNEIRSDNKPENLMAFTSHSAHIRFHIDPKLVKFGEIIFDGRKLKRSK